MFDARDDFPDLNDDDIHEDAFGTLLDDDEDDTDEWEPDIIGRAWEDGLMGEGEDLSDL